MTSREGKELADHREVNAIRFGRRYRAGSRALDVFIAIYAKLQKTELK